MGRKKKNKNRNKSTKDIGESLVSELGFDKDVDEEINTETEVVSSDSDVKVAEIVEVDNVKASNVDQEDDELVEDLDSVEDDSVSVIDDDDEKSISDETDESEFYEDDDDLEDINDAQDDQDVDSDDSTDEEITLDEAFEEDGELSISEDFFDESSDELDEDIVDEDDLDSDEYDKAIAAASSTRVEPKPAPKNLDGVPTEPPKAKTKAKAKTASQSKSKSIRNLTAPKGSAKRLRARKVRRVVRHIDPWSVLTFSVIFHLVVFGALFIAMLLILVVASWFNLLDGFEAFIREFSSSFETFEIRLLPFARSMAIFSFIMVLLGTMLHVLFAVLFNLISDLVGGVRFTVVEEDVIASKSASK